MIHNSKYIYEKASEFAQISPESIANLLDIHVQYVDFKEQKGVYVVIEKNKFIFVNDNLIPPVKNIVLLHEIGHDLLHHSLSPYFLDMDIFSTNTMEYEANLFAAHIILPDEQIIPLIYDGYSEEQIAAIMGTDENLVAIKAFDLTRRGHHIDCLIYNSMFLKSH